MKDHSLSAGRFALNRVAIAAAFSALAVLPVSSWALGLGKLNVQSALGEALRAEIDVTSLTPEEGASLAVRVATPDTYRAAGVDYNQVLTATSIVLQRRADGRPYLRIASDRTVQEPFVDVILDLSWSTGRLVREYTLLFDPPSTRAAAPVTAPVVDAPIAVAEAPRATAPAPKPVAVPVVPAEAPTPKPKKAVKEVVKAAAPAASAAASAPSEVAVPATPASKPAQAESPAAAEGIRVKRGDSLSAIAGRHLPAGVSLDQMLVGLYRKNPDAFLGNNMNRLKTGVVLNAPDAEQAKSVTPQEARQVIVAQSADFAAYRQQLAGAVGVDKAAAPSQQAKGKVEAEVTDRKQAAAPAPDKLTLSKGAVGSASAPAAEDRAAKARAKEDSTARVAELSKNLDELRKLKEKTAVASAPAKAAAPAPAPAPAVVTPPAPVASKPAPAPVPVAAPSKPSPAAPAVVVPPAPSAPASSVPALPDMAASSTQAADIAQAVASAASNAATSVADVASEPASSASAALRPSLPMQAPVPAAEPSSPSFLESLNPMLLAAGGAGVALLAGAAMYLRSRRRADTGETSFLESRLQPDSFFGASGGQRVDTRDASGGPSSMSYSLSQLDAIGDVDPVAEADVYLAYGRDLQAEEILKEALRSTPERLAVRTKLLEVYAKRRDTKGYEQLAVQLYHLTQGVGEDWAKAQEMGLGIDAENPLYQPGGMPSEAPLSVDVASDALGASTIPHSVMPAPSLLDTMAPPAADVSTPADLLNLDLDISAPAPLDGVNDSVSPSTHAGDLPSLDLPDIEGFQSPSLAPAPEASVDALTLPELDMPALQAAEPAPQTSDAGLDFDLSDELPATAPAPASFDLSSISLDLDPVAPAAQPGSPEGAPTDDWLNAAPEAAPFNDPMSRKFELAEEFRQIGDVDGARELLQEVLASAQDGALRAKAQNMLDSLG